MRTSRPPGYGAKGYVLQATLNYSRVSDKGSLLVRAGELSTAFGSFLLRYDDADNPSSICPIEYGYYYSPSQFSASPARRSTRRSGKWDGRLQFANSSPPIRAASLRTTSTATGLAAQDTPFAKDSASGVSAYRGPYLDRQYPYFFPGEANPNTLPANALGLDVNWAHGHTSVQGEVQQFVMPYTAIPTFREVRPDTVSSSRCLSPRWYVAVRPGFSSANASGDQQTLETAAGFRPNRLQLIKVGYEYEHYSTGTQRNDNTLAFQLVTTLHKAVGRE